MKLLFFISKSFLELTLFFAAAFLGVYLGLNFNEPVDFLGWFVIVIVIVAALFKGGIEYHLSK